MMIVDIVSSPNCGRASATMTVRYSPALATTPRILESLVFYCFREITHLFVLPLNI